jgi:hypothetical protein
MMTDDASQGDSEKLALNALRLEGRRPYEAKAIGSVRRDSDSGNQDRRACHLSNRHMHSAPTSKAKRKLA